MSMMRPPYIDPNTHIRYDTNNSEFEGWLTKQSMWVKVRYQTASAVIAYMLKFRLVE